MKNLEKLAELAKALPAPYQENAIALVERMGEVIEGFGDKAIEWRPETLKLVQGTSDRSKLPKGANIGSFVLGEDILEQPAKVIPLRLNTQRQYWDPNPDNAKMLCNSPDGQTGFQYGECKLCPYSKFDETANKSQCNKTLSVLCITEDLSKVFVVTFAKTNYMSGMDWQGLMKKAGVAPYKRIYTLSSQTSTKSKNVELIKGEITTPNRVEGAVLAFVEELFRISGEDRKVSLEKFYEYVKNKATNAANLLGAPQQVVELLTSDDSVIESEPVVEAAVTEEKTGGKKGTKYSL